jgi:tetratricopeptide (TPR) repeat protein
MWRKTSFFFLFILFTFSCYAQSWKTAYDSASLFWEKEQWNSTLNHLLRAEKLAQNDLGIYDPNYLTILNDLGLVYMNLGEYGRADQILTEAISLREEIGQDKDEEYRTVCQNYARLLAFSDPEKALHFSHALLDKFPEENVSLSLLMGDLHEMAGQLDSATFYYFQGNTNREKTTYEQQIKQIQGLRIAGDLGDAERLTDIYLQILSKKQDSLSISYLTQKSSLLVEKAMVLVDNGNYIEAENVLQEAAGLTGKNDLKLNLLNGQAILYARMGLTDRSLELLNKGLVNGSPSLAQRSQLLQYKAALLESQGYYDSAWIIYKEQLQLSHPPIQQVNLLLQAARTLEARDKLSQADSLLNVALNLAKQFNMSPPIQANLLVQQGYSNLRTGNFDSADSFLTAALKIKSDLFGNESLQLNEVKGNLALARLAKGDRQNAMSLLADNIEGIQRQIRYTFPILSQKEKVNTYQKLEKNFDRFNSLVVAVAPDDNELIQIMFNKQMLLKGLMLRTADRSANNKCLGAENEGLLKDLHAARIKLASLYKGRYSNELRLQEIESLENHINQMEATIASLCTANSPLSYNLNYTWKTISDKLNPQEALVELIRVPEFSTEYHNNDRFRIGFTGSFSYVALTIQHGKTPVLTKLPYGRDMESRFFSYYSNAIHFDIKDTLSYSRYWEPLSSSIAGKSRIYVINDGVYHKINLNNIQSPKTGKFLLHSLDLKLLVNPADILKSNPDLPVIKSALLMGDPKPTTITNGTESFSLKALPGTKKEIQHIQGQLERLSVSTHAFLNEESTITHLNKYSQSSIVHIASHGFFSPDLIPIQSNVVDAGLLASGLIFTPDSLSESNVLTAYEIQGMDFSQTELVILSACESGLGEIRNGEGIDGLQRAFLSSGAKTLLLSLWRVDDSSTEKLMTSFYSYYLKSFNSRDALKKAQSDMIDEGYPPRSWSAFIVSGN